MLVASNNQCQDDPSLRRLKGGDARAKPKYRASGLVQRFTGLMPSTGLCRVLLIVFAPTPKQWLVLPVIMM